MKNFQQNLLIVLALGLCALCAWQWYDQTRQRVRIEGLNHVLDEKSTAIQGYTNSIATMNQQIDQMDSSLTQLKTENKTNEQEMLSQKREINRLQITSEVMTNEIAQYTNAVNTLETRLKEAYAGIKKQNAAIQELTTQRDEYVQKLNASVKERNDIVDKYNKLVDQIKKQSSATNSQQ
jgi:chromosome segregation ATPase